jgi:hypothetical protein
MPVPNIEQLKEREASIKKRLADQGESPDRAKRRELGKKLRRVQRRRRRMVAEEARKASKPKEQPEAAAAPSEAAEPQEAKAKEE